MHQIAKHAAALRDAETQRTADARQLLRRQRIVLRRVPLEKETMSRIAAKPIPITIGPRAR
jgi:hypothetical protein